MCGCVGGENTHRGEEAVDEQFTDAEIRALMERAALACRRDDLRQRLEQAGDRQAEGRDDETTTGTPHETRLEQPAA